VISSSSVAWIEYPLDQILYPISSLLALIIDLKPNLQIIQFKLSTDESCSGCLPLENSVAGGIYSVNAPSASVTLQEMGMCFDTRLNTPERVSVILYFSTPYTYLY
jgi:hypothetical protein